MNDRRLVTRDYGYWVENELRATLRARGRARLHRLRHLRMRVGRRRGGLVGHGVRLPAPRPRSRGHARRARPRAGRGDRRRRAATRATRRDADLAASRPRRSPTRRRRGGPRRRRRAEPRLRRGRRGACRATRRSSASRRASTRRRASASRRSSATARSPSSPARTSPRRSSAGSRRRRWSRARTSRSAVRLQLAVHSTIFRVYVNDDIVGVELCAAAKNVIALAAGGADGLGLGDNAKAALVARGLAEMRRLAEAAGARPDTFAGLAGMGDLIVTCWSPVGPQPARRRADRPRRHRRGGRGGDRHGRRRADDCARAARPLAPARDRAPDHRGRLRGARRRPARPSSSSSSCAAQPTTE